MAKNAKICRYAHCPVEGKMIDTLTDEFVCTGTRYYHKSCYESYLREEEEKKQDAENKELLRQQKAEQKKIEAVKKAQINADIACILDLWQKHISNTVNYGYLRKILNEYLERDISSDYMVFTMQYVVSHNMPLRYPPGFRYMLDKQEIKDAYKKQQAAKLLKQQKAAEPPKKTNAPQFALNRQKSGGFDTIFNK